IFFQPVLDFFSQVIDAVRRISQDNRLAPRDPNLRGKRNAVAVSNLKWAGRFVDQNHFVTRGKNRHAWPLRALQLHRPDLRRQRQLRISEPYARPHDRLPSPCLAFSWFHFLPSFLHPFASYLLLIPRLLYVL